VGAVSLRSESVDLPQSCNAIRRSVPVPRTVFTRFLRRIFHYDRSAQNISTSRSVQEADTVHSEYLITCNLFLSGSPYRGFAGTRRAGL